MKILYVENNEKIIDSIIKEWNNHNDEIILVNNPKDALVILKDSFESIDIIVSEIDFLDLDFIAYLKDIRKIKKNISLVITSNKNIDNCILEFINIGIKKLLRKPFQIKELKEIFFEIKQEIKHDRLKDKTIKELQEKQLDLEKINEELNSLLKPFKEFSYYSQTDLSGVITDISDSFCNLMGYKKEEIIGKKHSIVKHPLEDIKKYKKIWTNLSTGKNWIGELRCKDKDGNDIWHKTIIFPKKDKNNKVIGYCAKRQNITDKKYAELLSITNDLTGLYNKRFFRQTFEAELSKTKKEKENLVFIMIDIDYFKKYNDNYGHLRGDEVLKKVAEVLKNLTKKVNKFAFRLGGEEFGIITSKLEENEIIEYVKTIKNSIDNLKIVHKNSPFNYISVSIGVCNLDKNDKKTCPEIYYLADKALYTAKNKGRNQICYEP